MYWWIGCTLRGRCASRKAALSSVKERVKRTRSIETYSTTAMLTLQDIPQPCTTEASRRVAIVMWCATCASIVFLLGAGSVAVDGAPAPTTPERDNFLAIFPTAGVVLLILSVLTSLYMRTRGGRLASALSDKSRCTRLIVAMLVSCGLNQSIAVLGFVITLVTKEPARSLPYCGVALAALIFAYPSKKRFERFMEGCSQASST